MELSEIETRVFSYPKDALTWWKLYIKNIPYLQSLAEAFGIKNFRPWVYLYDFTSPVSMLHKIWWSAPDNLDTHKLKGWSALCDLLSEADVLEVRKLKPYLELITLSPEQQKRASELSKKLSSDAIVAGGWVRDLLNGDTPKDIDVYYECADLAKLSASFEVIPDSLTEIRAVADSSSSLSGDFVESIKSNGAVQFIRVPDVHGAAMTFDAPCNMLELDRFGNVWAFHPLATRDARCRIWQPYALTHSNSERINKRLEKFSAKGYTIPPVFEAFPDMED